MKTIRMVWVVVAGLTVLFGDVGDASAQETVTYYHTDAIGSVRMVTDANGQVIARYDYLPFGEPWGQQPVPAEVVQFAGKERDPETGLNYFGARYYAGRNGRFTSVDPVLNIGQAMVDPQRWNRYIYALNRPLSMIDPDGREAGYLYLGNGRMADPYHGQYVFTNEGGAAFALGIILIGPAAAAAESIGPVGRTWNFEQ